MEIFIPPEKTLTSSKSILELRKEGIQKFSALMGWRNIDPNLESDLNLAKEFGKQVDQIVVFSTGGSRLSGWAIDQMLRPTKKKIKPISWLGHDLDAPEDLLKTKKKLGLIIVSQSGTTLEPLALYAHFVKKIQTECHTAVITRPQSLLHQNALKKDWSVFLLPTNVGGRFSAMTLASLVPLKAAGYSSLDQIVKSYKKTIENEWEKPNQTFKLVSNRLYSELRRGDAIEIIAYWHQNLKGLALWLQQLIGESEGKNHSGLYPVTHRFPRDLHSIEQAIQSSKARAFIHHLFLKKTTEKEDSFFTDSPFFFQEKILSLSSLQRVIQKSVLSSHHHLTPHVAGWNLQAESLEKDLGEFFAIWHLVISDCSFSKNINPFDQPGVEKYKQNLKEFFHEKK
jgi:glucose-6-phosphate isomerase